MPKFRASRAAIAAAGAVLLLATSACGGDQPEEATTDTQVRLYGTDGNMANSFAEKLAGRASLVNGMKGTMPMTALQENFTERLRSVDPKLTDYTYAGETYDAMVIGALAAQLAGTTDPAAIAKQIVGVTTDGERCQDPASCLQLARQGRDIEYRGVSVTRSGFTDAGEPSTASYATVHFDHEKLDDGKTEFVGAGEESAASTETPPPAKKQRAGDKAADAPLVFGGLLPMTGDLSLLYPSMGAAAALAIKEINAAGGVLGKPAVWIEGDDGTSPEVAKATVASHVQRGVHVIIGAGASGVTRAVLPDVVAAGRVLFSPSNTDAGLSKVEDNGLYFRTAPPDTLQGRALADVIVRDGPHKIAIVARKDSYGEGLQENVRVELERVGFGADRVKLLAYEPPADPQTPVDFSAGAKEIKDYGADAVLIIGFAESAHVITALADAGTQLRQ
ncbi:ABC transporter substrate-binding protein [Micromonospora sp. NPDC093277]|uniref:ABC transporter substrate-binding protein n=1 Tax=Micromonospora sp. NPDC093277 TaxID=3364291 RepID=UPI003817C31B